MILKERARIRWGCLFLLFDLGLAVYFLYLLSNWKISQATIILSLLTAVLALVISLLSNVNLRKSWKKK